MQDVPEEVLSEDHVDVPGHGDELHRQVVDEQVRSSGETSYGAGNGSTERKLCGPTPLTQASRPDSGLSHLGPAGVADTVFATAWRSIEPVSLVTEKPPAQTNPGNTRVEQS